MDSKQILNKMVSLWRTTGSRYRDGMIEVGRLIHEFILARLQEGVGLNEQDRRDKGCYRSLAMKECADRLGVKRGKANEILRAAMCVALLAEDGELGSLSLTSIRWFRLLIIRPYKGTQIRRNRKTGEGVSEIDAFEKWVVRSECPWAGKLFRQAVAESWTSERVYKTIKEKMGGIPLKNMVEETTRFSEDSEGFNPSYAIRNATVKDAAEMILEMINHSQDPAVLRRILQEKLRDTTP